MHHHYLPLQSLGDWQLGPSYAHEPGVPGFGLVGATPHTEAAHPTAWSAGGSLASWHSLSESFVHDLQDCQASVHAEAPVQADRAPGIHCARAEGPEPGDRGVGYPRSASAARVPPLGATIHEEFGDPWEGNEDIAVEDWLDWCANSLIAKTDGSADDMAASLDACSTPDTGTCCSLPSSANTCSTSSSSTCSLPASTLSPVGWFRPDPRSRRGAVTPRS
mmetsp:Transcript_40282/g.108860  ORF Transcript_40282/g.108860 Transcript_40282/m.108860 type:complete len:220 (-) Transcript_40282:231-890(-)